MKDSSGVETAFDLIIDELENMAKSINESGGQALQKGEYGEAEQMIADGKKLIEFKVKVSELSTEWRVLSRKPAQQSMNNVVQFRGSSESISEDRNGLEVQMELKTKKIIAKGRRYKNNDFCVLAGSHISRKEGGSLEDPTRDKRREMERKGGLKIVDGNRFVLLEDVRFSSPSAAARFVAGSATNGQKNWVEPKTGRQLGDIP